MSTRASRPRILRALVCYDVFFSCASSAVRIFA